MRVPAPRSTVQFTIGDIVHPQPSEVLQELFQNHFLEGEVIATTDDGQSPERFLVVRIPHLREPVIVPARAALPCLSTCPAPAGRTGLLPDQNGCLES